MSEVVRAVVTTNSCDDELCMVKVKAPLLWDESPLMPSVNGIPLKKDDIVFVDISDGVDNCYIIGRSFDNQGSYAKDVNGSLLFESSDGSNWTIAFVKNDSLEIYNSKSSSVTVKGDEVVVDAKSVKFKGSTLDIDNKTTITGDLVHSNGSLNCSWTCTGTIEGVLEAGAVTGTCTVVVTGGNYNITK